MNESESEHWRTYLRSATELALSPDAPHGPNPRVGCLIVDPTGAIVGRGFHRGAGTAHAEVDALHQAGERSRGATAVVTLEPCAHVGRTGPCTQALIDAGIAQVVYGQAEPSARGGATALQEAGISVLGPFPDGEWQSVNTEWTHFQCRGRPYVTLKMAMSLDGRVGLPGPTPLRITGAAARRWTHQLRSQVGAVLVGTGTACCDDPLLTVRDEEDHPADTQPLRVVVGERELPSELSLTEAPGPWMHLRTHDLVQVLDQLAALEVWHVLVEGGPTLARAFLDAGLVDRVAWFIAPKLVGVGPVSLPPGLPGIPAVHLQVSEVRQIGEDVLVIGHPLAPTGAVASDEGTG